MNDLNGYNIEDPHVGMSATFSKTITDADIVLFAGVSGDSPVKAAARSVPHAAPPDHAHQHLTPEIKS